MQNSLSIDLPLNSITDVLLLDHSDRMPDVRRCLDDVLTWIQTVRDRHPTGTPRVKAHPRETDQALLQAVRELDDVALPHWLPVEIYANCFQPNATIHCGLTTFIVSSRILIPGRLVLLNGEVLPEHAEILTNWDPRVRVRPPNVDSRETVLSDEDLCP